MQEGIQIRMKKTFVINTGSTSTKVAIFHDREKVVQANLVMPEEELKRSVVAVDQLPYRTKVVAEWLKSTGYSVGDLDAIAARGGPLPPVKGGAYRVNQLMIDVLTYAPISRHESALSCMIASNIARGTDILVIIYDSVNVDELNDVARYTGYPAIKNRGGGHVLNTRRAAKEMAKRLGKSYNESTFIVVHLGGSITVSAHERGRIVDNVTGYTGPMSPQRAGRIANDDLVRLCYSGTYTQQELLKKLNGGSGYMGYFGTQDARKVAAMMEHGDTLAKAVTDAMAYQTSKAVAEMRIAVETPVDRIIITGGMAHSSYITDYIKHKVEFIAPVEIMPGEFEMEALAEGALSVLAGEEPAKEYDVLPAAYSTYEEFYTYVTQREKSQSNQS